MANKMKRGMDAMPVQPRHGDTENVVLRCEVTPEIKDALVLRAEIRGITLKAVYTEAFEEYLSR